MFSEDWLLTRITYLVPLLLSLSVHEWAHAWTAFKLGDDTAMRLGRLTLNPLAHLDPLGTLALPLLGVPFGWAKPVPVNPNRFAPSVNMTRGMALTAAAGPLSNLCLALVCLGGLWLAVRFEATALAQLFSLGFIMNTLLAAFNMLPIPPLDGSRLVEGWVPHSWHKPWAQLSPFGPLILILLILMPDFLGFSLLGWPIERAQDLLEAIRQSAGGSRT